MKKSEMETYEAPYVKVVHVEMEAGICAASNTGKDVVETDKTQVTISEQGKGDDIDVTKWD